MFVFKYTGYLMMALTTLLYFNISAECCSPEQKRNGSCSKGCSWERTGGNCNFDGDCCLGYQCSAFAMCERCH